MSITDDKHVCNLCGEHLTSCSLCRGNPMQKLITREVSASYDREIEEQERSIRRSADIRSGWLRPSQPTPSKQEKM